MKKIIFLAVWALLFSSCTKEKPAYAITEKISELKAEYAPDNRVSIFNVEANTSHDPVVLKGETQYPEAKEALTFFLDTSGISFVDSITLLPDLELNGMHFGVVRISVCNIRSLPKHSAELSTQSTLGTPLRIWKKKGDWYFVQTPDKYLGWIDAGGFTPMSIEQYRQWLGKDKVIVTSRHSVVFAQPIDEAQIVSNTLAGNILLKSGGFVNGFYSVGLPDGRQGYIAENDVLDLGNWIENRVFSDSSIVATAHTFMGVPYLWGGTSPNGFDCSGFTKTVFYLNGMVLPRDASQQVHVGTDLGTDLDFSKWQPGDLLFFGKAKTDETIEKITHVAIYIGDGKMIHSAGNVKIESLKRSDPDFAAHRYDSFVRAKRMISDSGDNGVYALSTMPEYTGK